MPQYPSYGQMTDPARGDIKGLIKDISDPNPATNTKYITREDDLKHGAYASKVRSVTASGSVTLTDSDPMFVEIDPDGADRDVTLPSKSDDNHGYYILHSGSANTLSVKRSGGVEIASLEAGDVVYVMPSTLEDFNALAGGTGGGGGGDTVRTKYIITPSVSSNDLTLALKYIGGGDPSSTDKLTFRVGDTEYELTSAMSFKKNAGSNWCNAGSSEFAAKDIQYFVYAIGETGASAGLKFGYSRIPYARTMGDFINTPTDEKYIAGNWTNFNSTDVVTNIGRFQAQLSASASYNWSIPTPNVVSYPIHETDILTWQPTYSASGSMTYTSVTTNVAEYQVSGRRCKIQLYAIGTTGGTASNTLYSTLPFKARNASQQFLPFAAWTSDGGNAMASFSFINSSNLLGQRKTDTSNFGLGVNRYMAANGEFAIN